MEFKKYIAKFACENGQEATHVAFNGGKYHIPDKKLGDFYKKYYETMMSGEKMFIIEQVKNTKFSYFLDIEAPKNSDLIIEQRDIQTIIALARTVTENDDFVISRRIVNKKCAKYHVNFPDLIVKSSDAQLITDQIIQKLEARLIKAIDTSVYRTGLRLYGSQKSETDVQKERESVGDDSYQSCYKILDSDFDEIELTYDLFKKMIIKRSEDMTLTKLDIKESDVKVPKAAPKHFSKIDIEIEQLLKEVKMLNGDVLSHYSFEGIKKIVSTRNKSGIFCHYITFNNENNNYCPFKQREHTRITSPIYLELSQSGLFIKCYDSDCLAKKYPEKGLELPISFASDYPELNLSITTKYSSNVTVSRELKHLLEDSLSMSHFKIAKVAYTIYKDRFRIDDIKNPDWYEFDGHKWKKTHIMNILISEDLKKYYQAISGMSGPSVDLESEGTAESNMRNEMIQTIINKLENVTFKKNVLTEMHYLFKSLEPDFISKLDSNPMLMGFKNGVYDFSTSSFREGKHSDYLTFSTGYDYIDYDPEAIEVQEIYTFLSQIIPNKPVLEYLLKILGRSLIGIADEHFYIFTGLSGANGKSTLINFLEDTLGDYNTAVDVSLLTNKRALSASASPDVIRLKGKRIVSFAEPEYNDTIKTGILKAFSGGDSIIARELYKAPISFKLQASMLMACNDLPIISSTDGGTFRRLRVIEFKSRFCDNPKKENEFLIDPSLKTKMKNWRPYFMSILIHWYHVFQKEMQETNRIEEPEEVLVATNRYKNNNDKFNSFFEDCIQPAETIVSVKIIYNLFCSWWIKNNSHAKIPEMKEMVRAFQIKYGEDDYNKHRGFFVRVNLEDDLDDTFSEEF